MSIALYPSSTIWTYSRAIIELKRSIVKRFPFTIDKGTDVLHVLGLHNFLLKSVQSSPSTELAVSTPALKTDRVVLFTDLTPYNEEIDGGTGAPVFFDNLRHCFAFTPPLNLMKMRGVSASIIAPGVIKYLSRLSNRGRTIACYSRHNLPPSLVT